MNTFSNFKQDLIRAVELARFSPSSHNCQPWLVTALSFDELNQYGHLNTEHYYFSIMFDTERLLTSLPTLNKEMYISCGIFCHVLLKALSQQGYTCKEHWVEKNNTVLVIEVLPDKASQITDLSTLEKLVAKRLTNRGPYSSKKVTNETIKRWQKTANSFNCQLNVINTKDEIDRISTLIKFYGELDFSNKKTWKETYSYIRFDKTQEVEDGFFMENLFGKVSFAFQWIFRILFHPTNHWLSKRLGLPAYMAKGLAKLVSSTPQLMIISIDHNTNGNYWKSGYALSELYFLAVQIGLSIHPLSVLLQNDEPREKLQHATKTKNPIIFIARLGAGMNVGFPSPRRTANSIMKNR